MLPLRLLRAGCLQVHEKSILFPLLPISLLAMDFPLLAAWFPAVASFSMFPLLKKDQLRLAYIGCLMIWAAVAVPDLPSSSTSSSSRRGMSNKSSSRAALYVSQRQSHLMSSAFITIAAAACLGVHGIAASSAPSDQLPFLHDLLFVAVSFSCFLAAWIFLTLRALGSICQP